MLKNLALSLIVLMLGTMVSCQKPAYLGVGFYNVENLFDTIDDPKTIDEQFLPEADYQWDSKKYTRKLDQLATVISQLDQGKAPAFLGLCEVENRQVIEDLIKTPQLITTNYAVVHHESSDARGIDVAAIYDKDLFDLVSEGFRTVDLSDSGEVTRDILWTKLQPKKGEAFYMIVNHWPSRREGSEASEYKRVRAAATLRKLCDDLLSEDPKAQLVIMGDFNDEPSNVSLSKTLMASNAKPTSNTQLFNAMYDLEKAGKGSYCYRDDWNMLDQIIMNGNLMDGKGWEYKAESAYIMDLDWMRQHSEKYEGYPLRTFGGRTYLDGFSDHFPVLIHLERLTK